MKKAEKLIIPFVGLKEGVHAFDFTIGPSFFEQFDYSIIQLAKLHIDVVFEKKANLFNLQFTIKGSISGACDRCSDPINVSVEGEEFLVVKFDDNPYEQTDEIMIIPHGEYELDLSDPIYEFAHGLLPNKMVHASEAECNPIVIEKLNELSIRKENEGTDPRWDALSKLK